MVPRKIITLNAALIVATNACIHANKMVLKTSTRVENNNLDNEDCEFLATGTNDVINQHYIAARENPNPLILNESVNLYEYLIFMTSKYSLGNCLEIATHALDFIINNVKDEITAEIYCIWGGDHAFLVINKDVNHPGYDPLDPLTWGPNAVICDPWAKKIFPASQYKSELKNYIRTDGKNCIIDITDEQIIKPIGPDFDAKFLRQERNIDKLKEVFNQKINHILHIISTYKDKLVNEKNRLDQYGSNSKSTILSRRILDILQTINLVNAKTLSLLNYHFHNDYREANAELTKCLYAMYEHAKQSMQFNEEQISSLLNSKMGFFSSDNLTEPNIHLITQETNQKLKSVFKK